MCGNLIMLQRQRAVSLEPLGSGCRAMPFMYTLFQVEMVLRKKASFNVNGYSTVHGILMVCCG